MITCTTVGGIGNVLFQISMLLAYSLKYKVEYCIPLENKNPHSPEQEQFYSPNLSYCDKQLDLPIYLEKGFEYNEIPGYMDNVCFQGYWQSWKYLKDYRPQILTLLNIPKAIGYGRIFLHYRLGDYRNLDKFHKIISYEYIQKALDLFYEKGFRDVLVFSDEITTAEDLFTGNPYAALAGYDRFTWKFSVGTSLEDLSLMAACSGGIMSASAFSWFGAWLGNQNRTVVYPSQWFGENLPHDTKDLCPENWIAL